MHVLRPILFAGLAGAVALRAAAPVSTPVPAILTVDGLLADLLTLEKDVQAQIKALNSFQPGVSLLTPLQVTAVTVATGATLLQTTKCYGDVLPLPPFSAADSKRVVNQLGSTLALSDPSVCALVRAKKPQFDALLLSPSVYLDLVSLQAAHLLLSGSLTDHMTPEYHDQMKHIADITTDAINQAIQAYKPLKK